MDFEEIFMNAEEENRRENLFPQGKPKPESYDKYCQAMEIAAKWCRTGRISRFEYDAPEEKLKSHFVLVSLKDEDFRNETEIDELITFLKSFDSFGIYTDGGKDCTIDLALSAKIYE